MYAVLLGCVLAGMGLGGCQAYNDVPAPTLTLVNVVRSGDSLRREILTPGEGTVVLQLANAGPAMRILEFSVDIYMGGEVFGTTRFTGDVLLNENATRIFNTPLVRHPIPAARMATQRSEPLTVGAYVIRYIDGNNRHRTASGPARINTLR